MVLSRLATVVVALAATALLTMCSAPGPTPTGSATPTGTAAPTPTPTGLPADVAFVVSGTLVSPDGATEFDFAMTVRLPTTATATADAAAFAASTHCPPDMLAETPTSITAPSYVHVEVVTSGDPVPDDVGVGGMGHYASTWDGDYQTAQAYCAPPFLTPVPGTATAIGIVQTGLDDAPDGWLPPSGGYGLSAYALDPTTMDASPYAVTACTLELGPNPGAAAALVRVNAPDSCEYGLR